MPGKRRATQAAQAENSPADKETDQGIVQVRLVWGSVENIETVYVNHASIVHTANEFYLVFGELPMPSISDPSEVPDKLTIIPKVRLAISPRAMKEIARVISENYDKYAKRQNQ
jgi:hypothetical protein